MASTNRKVTKTKLRYVYDYGQTVDSRDNYIREFGAMVPSPHVLDFAPQIPTNGVTIYEFHLRYPHRCEYGLRAKEAVFQLITNCAKSQRFKDIKNELIEVSIIIDKIGSVTPILENADIREQKFRRLREISEKINKFSQNVHGSKRICQKAYGDWIERTQANSDPTQGSSSGTIANIDFDSNSHSDLELNLSIEIECEFPYCGSLVLCIEEMPDEETRLQNLQFALSPLEQEWCYLKKPRFVVDSYSTCDFDKRVIMGLKDTMRELPGARLKARFCTQPHTDQQWTEKQVALKQLDVTDIFVNEDKWKEFIRTVVTVENSSWCWDICLIQPVHPLDVTAPPNSAANEIVNESSEPANLSTRRDITQPRVHTTSSGFQINEITLRRSLNFYNSMFYNIKAICCLSGPTLTSWDEPFCICVPNCYVRQTNHRIIVRFCALPQSENELRNGLDCSIPDSYTSNWTKLTPIGPFDITDDYYASLSSLTSSYIFDFGPDLKRNPLCYGVYSYISNAALPDSSAWTSIHLSHWSGIVNENITSRTSHDSGNVTNASHGASSRSDSANRNLNHYNDYSANQSVSEDNSNRNFATDMQKFIQTNSNTVIQESINDLTGILTNPGRLTSLSTSIYERALGQMDIIDKLRRQFPNVQQSIPEQTSQSNSSYPYRISNRPQRTTVHSSLPFNSGQPSNSGPFQSTSTSSNRLNSVNTRQPSTDNSREPSSLNSNLPYYPVPSYLVPAHLHNPIYSFPNAANMSQLTRSTQPGHRSPYQSTAANSNQPSSSYTNQPSNPVLPNLSYPNRQTTLYSSQPSSLYTHQLITNYLNEPIGVHCHYLTADERRHSIREAQQYMERIHQEPIARQNPAHQEVATEVDRIVDNQGHQVKQRVPANPSTLETAYSRVQYSDPAVCIQSGRSIEEDLNLRNMAVPRIEPQNSQIAPNVCTESPEANSSNGPVDFSTN